MGIVARQSLINFFWSNIGIFLGALYTFLIIPRVFEDNPAQWGMIQLIIYYNQILLPISLLSVHALVIKFFPTFNKEGRANDLYSLSLTIITATVFLVAIVFILSRNHLLSSQDEMAQASNYILFVVPLLFFSSLFELFAAWSQVNLKSTMPSFLKDSFLKIWNFIVILFFYFDWIGFNTLIVLYFSIYVVRTALIFAYIKKGSRLRFSMNKRVLKGTFHKPHLSYMFFSVLGTASFTVINKLDVIMIGKMLTLQEVAFYSIGLALVAFVQLPEKSISAIAVPTLSHLLENNDHEGIRSLYRKTSINQLIISGFIFIGIWININGIAIFLGPKFGNIETVFLFLGLAKMIDVFSGLNGPLIGISKYYRSALVFQLILVGIVIASNLFFIPRYGINGAAMASFISLSIYNLIKTLFVYSKYKMWPFTYKSFIAIGIGIFALIINHQVQEFENLASDILVRLAIFVPLFIFLILGLRVSEDLNSLAANLMAMIRKKRN